MVDLTYNYHGFIPHLFERMATYHFQVLALLLGIKITM